MTKTKLQDIIETYIETNNIVEINKHNTLLFIKHLHNSLETTSSKNIIKNKLNINNNKYVPFKGKIIKNQSTIYISNMYLGLMTTDENLFNIKDFPTLMRYLLEIRKDFKTKDAKIGQRLIKNYLNYLYGSINNKELNFHTDNNDINNNIINKKNKLLEVINKYIIDNGKLLYYSITDTIILSNVDEEFISNLNQYLRDNHKTLINTDISKVLIDEYVINKSVVIIDYRKLIYLVDFSRVGVSYIYDNKVKLDNISYSHKLGCVTCK